MESITEIAASSGIKLREGLLGRNLCTFAIGGPVSILAEPDNETELGALFKFINQNQIPYRVLGAGSNVLFPDREMSELVIRLGRGFRTLRTKGDGVFEVGGSYSLMSLSRELGENGYSGLEFAGGIPASLGGAVRMNAGAHGSETASLLERVKLMHPSGEIAEINPETLNFSYRHSELPEGAMVIGASLRLVRGDLVKIIAKRSEYLLERKKRQPLTLPSAGSVFKNPSIERPAGRVIEELGLKGQTVGGARISELHGNWIVNESRTALAKDVTDLISLCQARALERFQLKLETELQVWG